MLQKIFLFITKGRFNIIISIINNTISVTKYKITAPKPNNDTKLVNVPTISPITKAIKITNINIAIPSQHFLFLSFLKHISTCGSII